MNILLTLLIFSLPLGVVTRINVLPNVYFYIHDLIAGLIFLLFLVEIVKGRIKIKNNKIFRLFTLFAAIGLISLVINSRFLTVETFSISFLYLFRFVVYFSIIFIVGLKIKEIKNLNAKMIISGSIFMAFGYVQYLFYPNLRNLYYAGWDDHLYRLFSTMLDPNFAGIFLVLFFILLLSNLINGFENKNKNKVLLYSVVSLLDLVAVYLTYSRSAFLALIAGVIVLLVVKNRTKFLYPGIAFLVAGLLMFSNFKIEGLNPLRIASAEARISSAQDAIKIIEKNPLIGVGFDSYRYAQIRYGLRDEVTREPSNADSSTDNAYLFIFATTGILGFAVFVKLLFEIIKKLKNESSKNTILLVSALPSFLALLVDTLFINSFFYPLIMIWVFILVGVSLRENKKQ